MSNGGIQRIRIKQVKQYYTTFKEEQNYFNNTTFNTFQNSYINSCSDTYIKEMASKLQATYSKIEKGYSKISKWWKEYNDAIESLEVSLSQDNRSYVKESTTNSYVQSKLPKLNDFKNILSKEINPNIMATSSLTFVNNEVVTNVDVGEDTIKGLTDNIGGEIKQQISEVQIEETVDVSVGQEGPLDTSASVIGQHSSALEGKVSNFFKSIQETGTAIIENTKTTISSYLIKLLYGSENMEYMYFNEVCASFQNLNHSTDSFVEMYKSDKLLFEYDLVDGQVVITSVKLSNGDRLSLDGEFIVVKKTNGSTWRYGSDYNYVSSVDGRVLKLTRSNELVGIFNNELDNVNIFDDFSQCGGNQMYFTDNNAEVVSNPMYLNILQEYFPDATLEDVELFAYCGTQVGCAYIATVNQIFKYFEGRESEFLEAFGYSMYSVKSDGTLIPNYGYVFFELLSTRYEGNNLEDVYGNIMDVIEQKVDRDFLMTGLGASALSDVLSKLCKEHGIDFEMIEGDWNSYVSEDLNTYNYYIEQGYNVVLCASSFDVYNYDLETKTIGRKFNGDPIEFHAMSIIGVTDDGKYIVSNWGKTQICDLSNADLKYFQVYKFANSSDSDVQVVQNYSANVGEVSATMSEVTSDVNATGISVNSDSSSSSIGTVSSSSGVTGLWGKIKKFVSNIKKEEENLLIVEDEEYNQIYDSKNSELEQYKELLNTYINAYNEEIENLSIYEEKLKAVKYSINAASNLHRMEDIANNPEYDKIIKEIEKEYGSYDNYKNKLETLKKEKNNFVMGLQEVEKQQDFLKYQCLLETDDYKNFSTTKEVDLDQVSIFTTYENYCEDVEKISPFDYAKAASDPVNGYKLRTNVLTDGYKILLETVTVLTTGGPINPLNWFTFSDMAETYSKNKKMENFVDASEIDPELGKMYNYIFENYGLEAANEYLDAIEGTVNDILGRRDAEEFLSTLDITSQNDDVSSVLANYVKVSGKGVGEGLQSFVAGFGNAISAFGSLSFFYEPSKTYSRNEYENMYILQALQNGQYGAGLTGTYEISQGIGNMLPSIAISAFCPLAGSIAMGVSAGGNSYHSALVEGYSNVQALTYGLISGSSEAILEKVLGGLPGVGKGIEVSGAKSFVSSIISEGFEESVQTVTDTGVRSILFGERKDLDTLRAEVVKSGIYGSITAGILQGGSFTLNKGLNAINDKITSVNIADKNINENIMSKTVAESSNVIKSFENQIDEVNSYIRKGRLLSTYTFKLNSFNEVTSELLLKIDDPSKVKFEIDGKVYDYIDMKAATGMISPGWSKEILNNNNPSILSGEISALLKKADIQDYYTPINFNQLSSILHANFDSVFGIEAIDRILYSINIVDEQNWQNILFNKGLPAGVLGFVDKHDNLILPNNASMHTAVHELLHKISNWQGKTTYDAFGNVKNVTGLREFYSDGSNTNFANERITDFLASKLHDNKFYNSQYDDGTHLNLLERFNDVLSYAYKDSNILLNSYVMNDKSVLVDFFSKYSTQANYNQFMFALNSPTYQYTDYLNSVISELENKFYPKKNTFIDSILSIFKKQSSHEYGIVSNEQQVLNKVCDPMNNYSNLDAAVSWFFENDGFNNPRPYNLFVTAIGKGKHKDMPSSVQIKNFLDRFNNFNGYNVENQGNYFTHVFSSTNYRNNKGSIKNRLYINAGHDDAYKFVQIFANKCESKDLPFYFKVANFEDMNNVPEISLIRDESIVIYSEDKYLAEYVNICNEIRKENPKLKFDPPPLFTGSIDGFIGYGGESRKHGVSYNSIRSNIMTNAIKDATYRFQQSNPNFNFFEMKNDWNYYSKYLDYINQYIKHYSESMGIDPNNFAFTID